MGQLERIGPSLSALAKDNAARVDALARCLAKRSDQFISAHEWATEIGDLHRHAADHALKFGPLDDDMIRTLNRYEAGYRSGGLP